MLFYLTQDLFSIGQTLNNCLPKTKPSPYQSTNLKEIILQTVTILIHFPHVERQNLSIMNATPAIPEIS